MEYLREATEELKRVDHLIYVSLKYTRTVDVIRNVINRLVMCFDSVINGMLKEAEEQGKLFEMPVSPKVKCQELLKLSPKQSLKDMVDFYLLMRMLLRCEYDKEVEYRRHVAMIAHLSDGDLKVDIDKVTEFYKTAQILIGNIEAEIKEKDDSKS